MGRSDRRGRLQLIPHVYADDVRDLYASLGRLQATDRFLFEDGRRGGLEQ